MDKRKNTIKINYIFSVMYQLLAIALPIVTAPYISRKLGVVNVGYYSHVMSIVSYFVLFTNLGTYTYGRREIGSLQKDREEYSKAFWNILNTKILIGIIALIAYGLFISFNSEFTKLYLINIFVILAQMFDISWFFQGLENYKITVTYQMIIKMAGAIAIFIFIMGPDDLSKYTFIMSFLLFAGTISIYPFLKRYVNKPRFEIRSLKKHIIGSGLLFIPQIATSLYMSVDKTMIGYFYKDGIQSGLYEQATKIDQIGLYVVIALTGVMIPRLALYDKENNADALKSSTNSAIKYIMFVGCPLAFGISGIGFNILPWFLGSGFEKSSNILQITAFIIIIMGITNYLGYGYLVATRQQKLYTATVFTGTVANIIMNYVLIPRFGGIGAAIASLSSETIVLTLQIAMLAKQLDLWNAFKGTLRYLLLSMIMGIAVLIMSKCLDATVINSVIVTLVGVAIYGIPLLFMKDFYIMKLLDSGKKIIRKFMNI